MNFLQTPIDPRVAVLANPNAKFSPNFPAVPVNVSPEVLRAAGLSPEQLAYQREQQEQAERIKRMQDLNAGMESQQALESLATEKKEPSNYKGTMLGASFGSSVGDVKAFNPFVPISRVLSKPIEGLFEIPSLVKAAYNRDMNAFIKTGDKLGKSWKDTFKSFYNQDDVSPLEHIIAPIDVGSTALGAGGFGSKAVKAATEAGYVKQGAKNLYKAEEKALTQGNTIYKKYSKEIKKAITNVENKQGALEKAIAQNGSKQRIANNRTNLQGAQDYLNKLVKEQDELTKPWFNRAAAFGNQAKKEVGKANELVAQALANRNNAYKVFLTEQGAKALENTADTIPSLSEEKRNEIDRALSAKAPESSKTPLAESGKSIPYYPPSDELNGENEAISQGYEHSQNNLSSPLSKYPTFNPDGNLEQVVLNTYEPSIHEQYTPPPEVVVNASTPAEVGQNSANSAQPSYAQSPEQEALVSYVNERTKLLNSLGNLTKSLTTRQETAGESIDNIQKRAQQIIEANESNPWFWVSNVIGAIPAMRQGISPWQLYENQQMSSINADPTIRANQSIINEIARVNPTDLEKLSTLANLDNTNGLYKAAQLGVAQTEAMNQNNISSAKLRLDERIAAINARNEAAKLSLQKQKLEVDLARAKTAEERLRILEDLYVLRGLEAQARANKLNADADLRNTANKITQNAVNKSKNQ